MATLLKEKHSCLKCTSSDGRRMYDDGTSYCFVCKTWFPASNEERKEQMSVSSFKAPGVKKETAEEIKDYPIRGFAERKIKKVVSDFFGVRVSYNDTGEIDTHYYPYNKGASYKVRKVADKDFYSIGKIKGLFGKELFNGGNKRLVITEGELDAMSVAQAHHDKYGSIYPVISLRSATTGFDDLLEEREWVRSFDEVVIAMDNDQAGQEALQKVIKVVGIDKAKLVKYPPDCKDFSDVLVKHGGEEVMKTVWNSTPYTPAGIIGKEELWEALQEYNAKDSIPYPECLKGVNDKLKGHRTGEIVLFISGTGCFGVNTEILMFDGAIKKVQDIKVGDIVMGDDNTPRNVLTLFRGEEQMYSVTLTNGDTFVCNESHVLTIINNDNEGRWGLKQNELIDIKLSDYLNWSNKRKHLSKAFRIKGIELLEKELPMHPYALGVWLGDGYSAGSRISSNDIEIPKALLALGYDIEKQNTAFAWSFRGVQCILKELNLINNKHLPEIYLTSSKYQRLELLAGLLDTDGCYDLTKNTFEFSQKSEKITDQVIRLCKSLGFHTKKGKQINNKFGNCFRVWISGEGLEKIPTRLPRKQARERLQIKDALRSKMEIKRLAIDKYFGFEVDGNNRFVLGNFIVTHNSGKSTLLREDMLHILATTEAKIGVVSLEEAPAETARKLSGMYLHRNPANEEIPLEDLKVGFDAVFGTDRVVLLDHQGSINDGSIIEQLEYMALMGCQYIYVDHITILVSEGAEGLSGNEAIDKVMNDLLRLVKSHDVWIGLVSHLRKTSSGKSFEEGQLPSIDDIRGSGSIKQISFDIIAFARNLTAADEMERNIIKMSVLKARYTGLTGPVPGAYYTHETGRLNPIDLMPDEVFTIV